MKLKKITFCKLMSRFSRDIADDARISDMLRYDVAFQSLNEPAIIAFPTFHTKAGALGGKATLGRWDSFGYRLEVLSVEESARLKAEMYSSAYVTYRHPRGADGRVDYICPLEAVTLEQAKEMTPEAFRT